MIQVSSMLLYKIKYYIRIGCRPIIYCFLFFYLHTCRSIINILKRIKRILLIELVFGSWYKNLCHARGKGVKILLILLSIYLTFVIVSLLKLVTDFRFFGKLKVDKSQLFFVFLLDTNIFMESIQNWKNKGTHIIFVFFVLWLFLADV